jgi:hypothetical protein
MTRQVTLREYLLQDMLADLNRRAKERGEDVEIVFDKPRYVPELATRDGEVVQLRKDGE